MIKRVSIGGAMVLTALMHWSCCGCDNPPSSPTAVATPTPTPAPSATPSASACTIGPVPAEFRCAAEPPPKFESIVVAAQNIVKRDHPDVFDSQGKVISQETYTGWVAQVLRGQGYCAIGGTDDEISIKANNDSSELYDLVTGGKDTWTNYVFTCRPALF